MTFRDELAVARQPSDPDACRRGHGASCSASDSRQLHGGADGSGSTVAEPLRRLSIPALLPGLPTGLSPVDEGAAKFGRLATLMQVSWLDNFCDELNTECKASNKPDPLGGEK